MPEQHAGTITRERGGSATRSATPGKRPPEIQSGVFTIYRLYDVGDQIDLARAQALMAELSSSRRPMRRVREVESIQIAQQPVRATLGDASITLDAVELPGVMRATIYDLGAVAIAIEVTLPQPTTWEAVADLFRIAPELPGPMERQFEGAIERLEHALQPAISTPHRNAIVEDYAILHVGPPVDEAAVAELAGHPMVWAALLGERRALSPDAAGLVTAMSYYPDDLALISWNGVVLIDPDPLAAATAVDLIEFAQVELLLMRVYDADLDAKLPAIYRLMSPRRGLVVPLVRGYAGPQREIQSLIAEVTEVTERVDNALKVTDDVYWNRIYSATLTVLRVDMWRQGVEHKLALLRETYSMLQGEASAERGLALELAIVLLIVLEIILALVKS